MATIDGEPVAHVAFSTRQGLIEARTCRLVALPEWQGIGIGTRFLNTLCDSWLRGQNRYAKLLRTLFNTSHPGLVASLRWDRRWTQVSASLYGENKRRSRDSINESCLRQGVSYSGAAGYGGHFQAVQRFRYLGDEPSCL